MQVLTHQQVQAVAGGFLETAQLGYLVSMTAQAAAQGSVYASFFCAGKAAAAAASFFVPYVLVPTVQVLATAISMHYFNEWQAAQNTKQVH